MSKRFTDTEIWKEQAWFTEMPPLYKLAWMYITDCCDHAGIWKIDVVQLKKDTGIDSFDLRDLVAECNKDYDRFTGEQINKERVVIVQDKWLWITGFIQFQYGNKEGTVRENNITKSAIQILKSLCIYDKAINKGFLTLEKGSEEEVKGMARDKDKDKDNIKDKKDIENFTQINNCPVPEDFQYKEFFEKYRHYMEYLEESFKIIVTPKKTEQDLIELFRLKMSGNDPVEVIGQTISANNKSFYRLRGKQFAKSNEPEPTPTPAYHRYL